MGRQTSQELSQKDRERDQEPRSRPSDVQEVDHGVEMLSELLIVRAPRDTAFAKIRARVIGTELASRELA